MSKLSDNDYVETVVDKDGIRAGAKGTVIAVFEHPNLAYEVEFPVKGGEDWVQATYLPNELSLVQHFA